MPWGEFLCEVVADSAGAAAGAAALPIAGPVGAAVAGAAAKKTTQELLQGFLAAQDDQLQRIEDINRDLQGRLIGLEQGMEILLDKSWLKAQDFIEEAARSPDREREDLLLARNELIDAWRSARDDTRRSMVAQKLVVVHALLEEPASVNKWLIDAATAAINAFFTQVETSIDMLQEEVKNYEALYRRHQNVIPYEMTKVGFCDNHLARGSFRGPDLPNPPRNDRDAIARAGRTWYGGLVPTTSARSLVSGLSAMQDDANVLDRLASPVGLNAIHMVVAFEEQPNVAVAEFSAKVTLDSLVWVDLTFN